MRQLLWLDDIRDPHSSTWVMWRRPLIDNDYEITWVKNYDEFTSWITKNGLPDIICFDHDLGDDVAREKVSKGMSKRQARREKRETKSGHDCAKWLVNYCMDNDVDLPTYLIQSANPVGALNIDGLLSNFRSARAKYGTN